MTHVGSCFHFHIAVLGDEGVGKTTLVDTWSKITSFDKFLLGASSASSGQSAKSIAEAKAAEEYGGPLVNHPLPPTEFSRIVPISVVVRECPESSAHRVYLIDTPGRQDRWGIRDGLIARNSLTARLSGAIVLVDSDRPGADARAVALVEQCVAKDVPVLLVYRGGPVPKSTFEEMKDVTYLATVSNDLIEVTRAFVDMVQQLHATQVKQRDEELERQWLIEEEKRAEATIKHGKPLVKLTTGWNFFQYHLPLDEVQAHYKLCLIGAPGSGKSTFVSSTLDDFCITYYEPTRGLEQGTCAVRFADGSAYNITIYDGALAPKQTGLSAAIVFLDVSSMASLEEVFYAIESAKLPPLVAVASTKHDLDEYVAAEDIDAFAGDVHGFYASMDPRVPNADFLVAFVWQIVLSEKQMKRRFDGQMEHLEERVSATTLSLAEHVNAGMQIPNTEKDLKRLFHRYDSDNNGLIDESEAELLFREMDKAGFGDCKAELKKIRQNLRLPLNDASKISFDQFCILMCQLAKQ